MPTTSMISWCKEYLAALVRHRTKVSLDPDTIFISHLSEGILHFHCHVIYAKSKQRVECTLDTAGNLTIY